MEFRTILILSFLLLLSLANSNRVIWDEVISHERLNSRINSFNKWYTELSGIESKVEAKLTEDPNLKRIGLFAKDNIKSDEEYLNLDRSKMIRADMIYETKIGDIIKIVEETFGYDDYTNMVFFLLHEMNNKDSVWKPYLDLLPRQPTTIAYKYWENKKWIESEIINTPILKKIIDYKFMLEKKANNYFHAIVKNNTNLFEVDFYNVENIEWACMILDSRLIYVDYEAFLIPMLDFANYAESKENPSRVFRAKFNEEYTKTSIKSQANVEKGAELFENLGYSNENYLLYHGLAFKDNTHDCFIISLSFSGKQDDNLKEIRKIFFARYFLYDKNNDDSM